MSLKFSDLAPSLDDAVPHYQQWLAKVDDLLPAVTLAPKVLDMLETLLCRGGMLALC